MQVFFLICINILLAVAGQTLIKIGVEKIGSFSTMPILHFISKSFLSPFVLGGLFLYLLSAVIWFMVLSKTELSVAYPTLSLGYILVLLIGCFFLGEQFTIAKLAGILLICSGIFIIFK